MLKFFTVCVRSSFEINTVIRFFYHLYQPIRMMVSVPCELEGREKPNICIPRKNELFNEKLNVKYKAIEKKYISQLS